MYVPTKYVSVRTYFSLTLYNVQIFQVIASIFTQPSFVLLFVNYSQMFMHLDIKICICSVTIFETKTAF